MIARSAMPKALFLLLAGVLLPAAALPGAALRVDVANVRNARGVVHACLTRDARNFLHCQRDAQALTRSVRPGEPIQFTGLTPGRYALVLFHDENANHKLDMMLGIPREGFGFSRNPKIRFGAPRFEQVVIELGAGFSRQMVRMQYVL